MKRNNSGSLDSEAECLIPRMRLSAASHRGDRDSSYRVRRLSAEIEDLSHRSSLGMYEWIAHS